MTLKGNPKFKGKLTRGLKNDIRYLANFHVSSRKSKFALSWAPFVQKYRRKSTKKLCPRH